MKKVFALVLAVMLALSAVAAVAAEYTDKDTVKKVQQALNDAGYDCGTPDGAAGKKTKAAITSYQTDKGLTVTGVIDDELLVALGLSEEEATEEAPAEGAEEPAEEAAETGEEYTFQGIPWGSSPEEVEAILVENGLVEEGHYYEIWDDEATVYYPGNDDESLTFYTVMMQHGKGFEGIGAVYNLDSPKKTIAGQEVSYMWFSFICGSDGDSLTDDLHLSMIRIMFKSSDGLFEGLSEQLSTKYGTYNTVKAIDDYHVWEGHNNTIIGLMRFGPSLIYAKTDDYDKALQLEEIYEVGKTPLEDVGL